MLFFCEDFPPPTNHAKQREYSKAFARDRVEAASLGSAMRAASLSFIGVVRVL
jgi:hypothetical protein